MQIGRFTIEQLSEGLFEIFDNSEFRKVLHKEEQQVDALDNDFSSLIGIDPILVRDTAHKQNILLDAGIGLGLDKKSRHKGTSNILSNLEIFDLTATDIDYVLLSHLHYDHAAGVAYSDSNMVTKATFPNAKIIVQQREWDYAVSQFEKSKPMNQEFGYQIDDLFRLKADGRLEFVEGNKTEIIPGISVMWTGGHTPGHQMVEIEDEDEGESAYYLGDLLPDENYLNTHQSQTGDYDTVQTQQLKNMLLHKALKKKAVILFYHSQHHKAGTIDADEDHKFKLYRIDA